MIVPHHCGGQEYSQAENADFDYLSLRCWESVSFGRAADILYPKMLARVIHQVLSTICFEYVRSLNSSARGRIESKYGQYYVEFKIEAAAAQ